MILILLSVKTSWLNIMRLRQSFIFQMKVHHFPDPMPVSSEANNSLLRAWASNTSTNWLVSALSQATLPSTHATRQPQGASHQPLNTPRSVCLCKVLSSLPTPHHTGHELVLPEAFKAPRHLVGLPLLPQEAGASRHSAPL